MVRQILDRGHFEIWVDDVPKTELHNISIFNKELSCEELYDENLNERQVLDTIAEIDKDAKRE
jgi:hypothetical protein